MKKTAVLIFMGIFLVSSLFAAGKTAPVVSKKKTPVPAAAQESFFPDNAAAYVNEVEGECQVKRKGESYAETIKDIFIPLYEGDTVYTEIQSKLEIIFDDATIIKLDPNSKLTIKILKRGKTNKTILDLIKGSLLSVVKKLTQEEEFSVKTKMAMAAVKGTEFVVTAGDDDKVAVFDGAVSVTGYDMDGNELHSIILDKDKETVITKKLRKPEKAKKLSRNFVKRYSEIKDMRGKIEHVRQLRRDGKIKKYRLERRLERIDNLKMMKSSRKLSGKMSADQKEYIKRMEELEPFYRAQLNEIERDERKTKQRIKKIIDNKKESNAADEE
jgi:hypothetical protein